MSDRAQTDQANRLLGATDAHQRQRLLLLEMPAACVAVGVDQTIGQSNDALAKSGKGAADIKYFQGSTDLALALLNAQVDVWVTTSLTMNAQMKKYPDKFELVGNFGEPLYYAWATRPNDASLRDAIDVELRRLRDSGDIERLQQKWFGLTMKVPDPGYLPEGAK